MVVNGSDAEVRHERIAAGMLGLLRQALAGDGITSWCARTM